MKGIGIALLPLAALAMASCGKQQAMVVEEEKAVPVTVAQVAKSSLSISRVYTGTLEGWRQAQIYASIPEAVVELPIPEGGRVQAGQAVIVLDRAGSSSQLRQLEAVYNEARENFERLSRLHEQGAISQQAFDNARTGLDVARANYEAARQRVELTSPIGGVLTDLAVNVGQYASLGVPLATVAQTEKLRMTIYVDGRSVAFLQPGQTARISVAAAASEAVAVEGHISEIARSADPETRLFGVELQIDNADRRLAPGTFARAEITVREIQDVLTVPRQAVFFVEGIPKVYTVNDSSRAVERSIEIGESTLEKYQVTAGLNESENVILLGKGQVEEGSLVKISEPVSGSGAGNTSREG